MKCTCKCHFDKEGNRKDPKDNMWCFYCNTNHLDDMRHGSYKAKEEDGNIY